MNRRLFYLSSSVIATGYALRDLAGNVVDSNRLLSSVLDSYNGVVRQSIGFLNRWYNAEWQVLSAFATLLPISFSEEQPKESGEPSASSSSSVVELTGDDFARAILRSDKDMLVVFYAPWCGYCRRLCKLDCEGVVNDDARAWCGLPRPLCSCISLLCFRRSYPLHCGLAHCLLRLLLRSVCCC